MFEKKWRFSFFSLLSFWVPTSFREKWYQKTRNIEQSSKIRILNFLDARNLTLRAFIRATKTPAEHWRKISDESKLFASGVLYASTVSVLLYFGLVTEMLTKKTRAQGFKKMFWTQVFPLAVCFFEDKKFPDIEIVMAANMVTVIFPSYRSVVFAGVPLVKQQK